MSRLYGDQLQSAGKRYFFALDSVPGIVSPGVAVVSLQGRIPAAAQPSTVFRSPAPATITLQGQLPRSPVLLSPAAAVVTSAGRQPSLVTSRTITNALPDAVETPPVSFAPTLITIWTSTPAPAQISIDSLPFALTQGGNIGFVSPAPAQVSFGTLQYTLLYGEIGLGAISIQGRAPTLISELVITPEPAMLAAPGRAPRLALPFRWVDDRPAKSLTWLTNAAA